MSEKKRHIVVGIGEILWDIYREKRFLGGAPANFAIHANQLGCEGYIVSRVGRDGMGDELVRALKEHGISSDYVQSDKKKGTGTVLIQLDVRRNPSFHCSEDVAFDYLEINDKTLELMRNADAIVFGTLGSRKPQSQATIETCIKACRGLRIFDINARKNDSSLLALIKKMIPLTDILKVNDDEIDVLMRCFDKSGADALVFLRELIAKYRLKYVVVTRAEKGAVLVGDDIVERVDSLPIQVKDATGAGDAFTAGLIVSCLNGEAPEKMLEFANQVGAFVCQQEGATPKLSKTMIEKFSKA